MKDKELLAYLNKRIKDKELYILTNFELSASEGKFIDGSMDELNRLKEIVEKKLAIKNFNK